MNSNSSFGQVASSSREVGTKAWRRRDESRARKYKVSTFSLCKTKSELTFVSSRLLLHLDLVPDLGLVAFFPRSLAAPALWDKGRWN
jgi:hypothetical protein